MVHAALQKRANVRKMLFLFSKRFHLSSALFGKAEGQAEAFLP